VICIGFKSAKAPAAASHSQTAIIIIRKREHSFRSLLPMLVPAHGWLEKKQIPPLIGHKSATWTSSSNR